MFETLVMVRELCEVGNQIDYIYKNKYDMSANNVSDCNNETLLMFTFTGRLRKYIVFLSSRILITNS